jgi:hypothetical protein
LRFTALQAALVPIKPMSPIQHGSSYGTMLLLLIEWIGGVLRRSESARSSAATPWQPAVSRNCASLALEIFGVAAALEFNDVDLQAFTRTCFEVGLIFYCVSGQRTAWTPPSVLMLARMARRLLTIRMNDLWLIARRRQPAEL